MRRALTTVVLLALMAAFGFGVNRFLASKRHAAQAQAAVAKPTQVKPAFILPGTLYLAQHGDIYRLHAGTFADLHLPNKGTWMQPAVVPGTTNIVAVLRTDAYSDLYLISSSGATLQQLTHNATSSRTIQLNHWVYWPAVAADGNTIYVSYDSPKTTDSYRIDFAVWKGVLNGVVTAHELTVPFQYTGGDVKATPMSSGNVLYAKYQISGVNVFSRIALQTKPLAFPVDLTAVTDDCGQPALSPDETLVAMLCEGGTGLQSTRLEVAPLTGSVLGAPRVLVDNCLCAAPVWAPDGSGLVYDAPADASGHFQLWWIAGAAGVKPKAPRAVTDTLDLDALSPVAWIAGQ